MKLYELKDKLLVLLRKWEINATIYAKIHDSELDKKTIKKIKKMIKRIHILDEITSKDIEDIEVLISTPNKNTNENSDQNTTNNQPLQIDSSMKETVLGGEKIKEDNTSKNT